MTGVYLLHVRCVHWLAESLEGRKSISPVTVTGDRTYTTKHGTVATMNTSGISEEAARRIAEATDKADAKTKEAADSKAAVDRATRELAALEAKSKEKAKAADAAAERIRVRMKRTAEDIIEIGRDLIAVKERLGHGKFLPWIEAEFGMAERQAQRFMAVAEKFKGKYDIMSDFSPTALYLLASAPAEVVAQVEAKAAAGEDVPAAEIARLKAEHKAEVERLKRRAILQDYDPIISAAVPFDSLPAEPLFIHAPP